MIMHTAWIRNLTSHDDTCDTVHCRLDGVDRVLQFTGNQPTRA